MTDEMTPREMLEAYRKIPKPLFHRQIKAFKDDLSDSERHELCYYALLAANEQVAAIVTWIDGVSNPRGEPS